MENPKLPCFNIFEKSYNALSAYKCPDEYNSWCDNETIIIIIIINDTTL